MDKYPCFDRVLEIEKEIFKPSKFTGKPQYNNLDEGERGNLESLLNERRILMNRSCPSTAENQSLFWDVTKKFRKLVKTNKTKVVEIVGHLLESPFYKTETDWCITAGIFIDPSNPIIGADDDISYGSDFFKMRSLLSEAPRYLQHCYSPTVDFQFGLREYWRWECLDNPALNDWYENEYDPDVKNWLSETAVQCEWLVDQSLKIPYIAHEILDLKYFSVPDYLRLGLSLKGRIHLLVQHYVNDNGDKVIEE